MRVSCGDDETRLESRFWHESFGPLFATCSGRYCAFFPLRSIFSCVRFLACVATLFHLALGLIFSWRALYFQQGFASSICWSWQRESSGAARIVPSFFLRSIVINFLPLLFIVATLSLCLVPFHLFFSLWLETDIARISTAIHSLCPPQASFLVIQCLLRKRGNCYSELPLTKSFALRRKKKFSSFSINFFLPGFNDRTPFSYFNDYDFREVSISIARTVFGLRKVIVWVPGSICLVEFFKV